MTESGHKGENMRVLVTGSTQGIGKAVAAALAERGYEVIVHCSRDAEKARRVKEEIGAFSSVVCDLSRLDEVKGLHGATGDVDCLILNASIQNKEKWTEVSIESLEKQIAVNLESTLLLMQAYYPAMADRGFGRIITVGSVNQHRRHNRRAGKLHAFPAAQHVKAQPERYKIGKHDNHAVRQQIERIKKPLIALDHMLTLFLP